MANFINGKREEIRGLTTLDIRNINNNFKLLFLSNFDNINYADKEQTTSTRLNNIDNKVSTVAKNLEAHKNNHFTGEYKDLKNIPTEFNPAYTMQDIGGIILLRQGKLVFMQGNCMLNQNSTGSITLFVLPSDFKPYNYINVIFCTISNKAFNGYIDIDGKVVINLGSEVLANNEIIIINNLFVGV